jgi:hypothetical protein
MYPRPYDGGFDPDEREEPRTHRRSGRRFATPVAIGVAVAVVLSLGAIGWALLDSGPTTPAGASGPAGDVAPLDEASTAASASPSASPSPSRSAKPTPSKSKKPATKPASSKRAAPPPKPKPTAKPPKQNLPPAPPTSDPEVCVTPTKYGSNADDSTVRSVLSAAAARNYWNTANLPDDLAGQVPAITVPNQLMWAIAYQESSWRSSVVSCDGGIGLMQITRNEALDIDTATWMNNRYGTSYDPTKIEGNAALGAEYIEYEIMYFVLNYRFRLPGTPEDQVDFDLDATANVGPGGAKVVLRDVVISGYNVGIWNVIQKDGSLKIINPGYVSSVYDFIDNECEGRCA